MLSRSLVRSNGSSRINSLSCLWLLLHRPQNLASIHRSILMCFSLFGFIQRAHLRHGFLFTVTVVNGTMQPVFFLSTPNKVTQRLSVLLVHPLTSYNQTKHHGEGNIYLLVTQKHALQLKHQATSNAQMLDFNF